MNQNQVDNLLKFTFIMTSNSIDSMDYFYIKEKWDKFININYTNINKINIDKNHINQKLIIWKKKWNCDDVKFNDIYPILITLNEIKIDAQSLWIDFSNEENNAYTKEYFNFDQLISVYNNIINTNQIESNETIGGIHKNIEKYLNEYKIKNLRLINLNLLSI
jgi:hypothetical protein